MLDGTQLLQIFIVEEGSPVTGYTICNFGCDGVDVERLPGELVEELQERCRAEDLRLRAEQKTKHQRERYALPFMVIKMAYFQFSGDRPYPFLWSIPGPFFPVGGGIVVSLLFSRVS